MRRLLFVGECRSLTAQRKGWTWRDGRLAAKPLFEALEAMGVDPRAHSYLNLWEDTITGATFANARIEPAIRSSRIALLRIRRDEGWVIVALGKKVSAKLTTRGIDHVALVHPAARGKIRKRERYHAHVKAKLKGAV